MTRVLFEQRALADAIGNGPQGFVYDGKLRFFRSVWVCDANQFCFVLFAICGFCTVRRSSAVCKSPAQNVGP